MSNIDSIVWGMHAGRIGDADSLFLKKDHLGIGWSEVGDLSKLEPNRDSFKAKVAECYPDKKPGAIPIDAGQLYRFAHEMKTGDTVIFTGRHDREVHIGRVSGDYHHDPGLSEAYPNVRPVKWLQSFPRTRFSQGALYEIGSAMSLFQVRNYADEFLAALEGESAPVPVEKDETIALVAEEIEDTTHDFILKKLAQELKGHPLAHFVAHLLEAMGYRTRISPEGPDGGIDIIAHKDELGFEPPIIKVQVKSTEGSIGDPVLSALLGKLAANENGLLVTLGKFTPAAAMTARGRSNLRLIDGEELVNLILEHYEQFEPTYKALLPLKRVYVPAAIES